ncbi:dimethylarginine dimethylaminohydrolase family protein [Tetragenococcus halophilus]|uniref:dimethylarginine dimethylaminohydrolase family protein n=1 Tax=Tetragenococcus halophilus TaxID=51669 RepID=UPI00209AE1E1|nr:arginine deiminase family protein [Tetragenococcus halophilus]MCO8287060.1 amidinotransferase [Tetragenococcus halophilus]
MNKTKVVSEFAPLKATVLAQSQFCFPEDPKNSMDTSFLTKENVEFVNNSGGKDVAEADEKLQRDWEQEKIAMQSLLESYGVEVLRPRLLTQHEKDYGKEQGVGYSNFFSRDPFFTIGSFIIEGNLRFMHRRREIFPIRPVLNEWVKNNAGYYFAAPQPDLAEGENSEVGPFIEGGDVVVLGKTVFVGYSGLASNLNGIYWLKQLLEQFDYKVIPVRLHPSILHLDCALSMLKEGLMITCEEAFLDGLPEELKDWEKINVSLAEAANLIANDLPINEQVYVTDQAFTDLIAKIKAKGIKVETLDYHVSRMFGGSFRCTTQALIRE